MLFSKYFKKILIISSIISPVFLFTSCSSSTEAQKSLVSIKEFIDTKKPELITIKNSAVLNYPTEIYFDKPETINQAFEISDLLKEKIKSTNIKSQITYKSQMSNGVIEFQLELSEGDLTEFFTFKIKGFILPKAYEIQAKSYFQTINLNANFREKETLKSFITKKFSNKNKMSIWPSMIEYKEIPGFKLEFNQDIITSKFNYNENYIVIGTFAYFTDISRKQEIKIPLKGNFISPTNPLCVFVVQDNGFDIIGQDIVAEIIFINRTTDNIIRFKETFYSKNIFGILDLSEFLNWEFNPAPGHNGFFQSNNITQVLLPKFVEEIQPKMFLNNRINTFKIPNNIKIIANNSFDNTVKFSNIFENPIWGLKIFYKNLTKTLDFSQNQTINLNLIYSSLYLLSRQDKDTIKETVEKIILPANLFQTTDQNDIAIINKINGLAIEVKELNFFSITDVKINDALRFKYDWKISKLVIPKEIIAINMAEMRRINSSNVIIERTLNQSIKDTVDDKGILDLRRYSNDDSNENLDNYYDTGNKNSNIIKEVYLKNTKSPNTSIFNAFKTIINNIKNKIHVSDQTILFNCPSYWKDPTKFLITRMMPSNLTSIFNNGHLNLTTFDTKDKLVNFNLNLQYLSQTINEITFSPNLNEIPDNAFREIDLSKLSMIDFKNISTIGQYSFYNSKLAIELNSSKIKSIGSSAFSGNQLKQINFSELIKINNSVFSNNEIININLPKVTLIGSSAFSNNKLVSIDMPQATRIDASAFSNNKLVSISVPNVINFGSNAFRSNMLSNVSINPGATLQSDVFLANSNIMINNLINRIEGFYNINNLGKITIDFTKVIEQNRTFNEAINELNWLIPLDKEIDELRWDLCLVEVQKNNAYNNNLSYLTNISKINKLTILRSNPSCQQDEHYIPTYFFQDILINDVIGLSSVNSIGVSAFSNCGISLFDGKNELILGKNLWELGSYAFQGNKISSLNIMPSILINEIKDYVFNNNKNLTSIKIPSQIRFVNSSAFSENIWKYVDRKPPIRKPDDTWSFSPYTGELIFKEKFNLPSTYTLFTKLFNGLKIKKISFNENIYQIPDEFLRYLKVPELIEIDLSHILIIGSWVLPSNIRILDGTAKDVLYNSVNSGITIFLSKTIEKVI